MGRQNWAATWTTTGDAYYRLADLNIGKGVFDVATDAWLCALTAFEVARRLVADDNRDSADVSAKVEAGVQRFALALGHKVESLQITCGDQIELSAYCLPAGTPHLCGPAVICVSSEEENRATLLGRLLPVVIGRGMSVLVVSHEDIANQSRGESEILLSHCLDHLSARPDVDSNRIAVYGDGLSAALATDFAAYDSRVAAAVCDAGIWNWTRTRGSIGWMTSTQDDADKDVVAACRSRLARQLNCPILVVAGGRGIVSVSEAIKLQADCMAASVDLDLAVPQIIQGAPGGEVDNFVTSDDNIFRWLEKKLTRAAAA
ncbi:S9 family peptidase [Bradyrhizobium sp. sBnM-33]|uniref:alpha/beta hydrolase family protein n=1 Tax=Bradyrhizobium sp. sBnM-33 TaxID=2831780 RepID=UPI001BD0ED7A|nr:alpha/beta hydrolase [Bradyrhizobium sp. sBnM-33]WOH52452.1 alpha/beta hydrolase [Bradyrhizobium sp. sBnM-33]